MTKTIGILFTRIGCGIREYYCNAFRKRIKELLVEQARLEKHQVDMMCLSTKYKDTFEYAFTNLAIAKIKFKIEILKALVREDA